MFALLEGRKPTITVRTENFQMHYILYLSGLEIISVINLKISTMNEICRLKYDKLVSFYI